MVLGCMPSALPVDVRSGRSSRIVVLTPYRARLFLYPAVRQHKTSYYFEKQQKTSKDSTYASIKPDGPAPTTVTLVDCSVADELLTAIKPSSSAPGAMLFLSN